MTTFLYLIVPTLAVIAGGVILLLRSRTQVPPPRIPKLGPQPTRNDRVRVTDAEREAAKEESDARQESIRQFEEDHP